PSSAGAASAAGASASAAGASASASATRSTLLADSAVVVPSSSLLLVTMLNKPTTATTPTPHLRKPRFFFFCGSWAIGACICGEGEPWEGLAEGLGCESVMGMSFGRSDREISYSCGRVLRGGLGPTFRQSALGKK